MAIPDFNPDGVLPPHLGDPRNPCDLSPFPATSVEVCQKFGGTPERREILRGWLQLRDLLRTLGHSTGRQWIDGSFMEDCEATRLRPPGDIDVISFLPPSPTTLDPAIVKILSDRKEMKKLFKVDHMIVRLHWGGMIIVDHTRYWCGLFSHRTNDGAWKGMLQIDLDTKTEDDAGRAHLDSLGKP